MQQFLQHRAAIRLRETWRRRSAVNDVEHDGTMISWTQHFDSQTKVLGQTFKLQVWQPSLSFTNHQHFRRSFLPDGSRIDGTSLETNKICKKFMHLTRHEDANVWLGGRQNNFKLTRRTKPRYNHYLWIDRPFQCRLDGDVVQGKFCDHIWRIEENVLTPQVFASNSSTSF